MDVDSSLNETKEELETIELVKKKFNNRGRVEEVTESFSKLNPASDQEEVIEGFVAGAPAIAFTHCY